MSYPVPPPPPHGQGPAPVRRRGRVPLLLAAIFGVVGVALVVVGGLLLGKSTLGGIADFPRVPFTDGPQTVHFDDTGDYLGYYEEPGLQLRQGGPIVQLAITAPNGQPVQITNHTGAQLTYNVDNHQGNAVFDFRVDQPGDYTVQVRTDTEVAGAGMAFGKSFAGGLIGGLATLIPGVLLVVAAIVLLIVGLVLRSRSRRQQGY